MKKLLLVCMLVFLCSCQKKELVDNEKPLYFVFATPLSNHTLWGQAKEGMQTACEEYNVECDWQGPIRISTTEMEDAIETALLKKADGIITQGVVNKALIEKGMAQDIPIILVDSPITGADPLVTISKNFDEQAELLLKDIETNMGENTKLKIGIQVSDKTFDLAIQQIASVQKIFKQHPGGFEIIAVGESNSDKAQAKSEWIQMLQNHQDMNVALNFSGEGAVGIVNAMDYLHRTDAIQIYGVDDMEDTINLIKKDKIAGSIVTSFYRYGYDSVKTLFDYIKHDKKPEDNTVAAQILLVNKDNVSIYPEVLK